MRHLIWAVIATAPVMVAQSRGGGRTAPARRMAAPGVGPVAPVRPIGGVVPAAYLLGYYPNPLYYGSGDADPSAYGYAPQQSPLPGAGAPPTYYSADPNGQGYPSVLINPNYVPETSQPVMRDYSYLPPTPGDAGVGQSAPVNPPPAPSVIFLIAMQDHTIYPAIAYWVENDTLNYIGQQGVRSQAPLAQVDREFSVQLNKERNIDFALPNPKGN